MWLKKIVIMAAKGTGLCTIVATVPTGLEKGAAEECKQVLGRGDVVSDRGKIIFQLLCLEELAKVDELRSIENFSVLVKDIPDWCKDESSALERLFNLPSDASIDWSTPLSVWRHYQRLLSATNTSASTTHIDRDVNDTRINSSQNDQGDSRVNEAISDSNSPSVAQAEVHQSDTPQDALKELEAAIESTTLSPRDHVSSSPPIGDSTAFRVTCVRGGRKHVFSSMEAAGRLGAGLEKRFGWKVLMKNYDIEVLLNIRGDGAKIFIALSQESKSKRNITHFGPTTLKSVIAYGMLRLANIRPGEVVLDPLCGGGSISIEGSLAWPSTYHLLGDNHEQAAPRAMANCTDLRSSGAGSGLKMDILQWDVRSLPLRTACVDIVVTDLPFGKKSGRKVDNRVLYPLALEELGRVCKPTTSRAVLLTHDNKSLSKALLRTSFWKRQVTKWINIGGLKAAVYILHRTGDL